MPDYDLIYCQAGEDQPVAGIPAGTAALWRGSSKTDFGPAIDPLGNLARVKFHSAFDYLRVAKVVKSTDPGMSPVTIPAQGENLLLEQNDLLFAHGMGFRPLFFKQFTVDGYKQPGDGSPMLNKYNAGRKGEPRFFGMTANATNVYLHSRGWFGPATTIHWTVWILNERFGVTDRPDTLFEFRPDGAVLPKLGKIDEDHLFVRKVTSSPEFRFIGRPTFALEESGGFTVIAYHDGQTKLSVSAVNNNFPSSSFTTTSVDCDV
ncbi:hypothetical protein [Parvibaculum sp.]|uniref:hypothetical protein n=1 Tax=Parvibaculum sp. TaxID=2024848 RepID=UPI00391BD04B